MELDNEASSFLTLHQRLEFSCSNHQKSDPSKLSDTYRNTYLHLMQTTLAPSEIDGTHDTHRLKRVLSPLMSEANKYLDKYTQIVDKIDGTGLNNFAEGALALCSYHKNESMKWKTSLSVEKIFEMPCMQTVKTKESSVAAEEDCMITIQSSSSSDLESATKSHEPDAVQQNQVLMKQSSNPPTCSLVGQTVGSMEPASGTGMMASASMFPSGLSAFKNADTHARCGWQQSVVSNARNGSFQNQPGPGGGANGWNGYQPPHGTSMEYGDSRRSRNGVFQNQIPSRTGDEEQMGPAGYSFSSTRGKRSGKPWMKKDEEDDEDIDENDDGSNKQGPFRTAKQQLVINQQKKYGGRGGYGGYDRSQLTGASYGGTKKSLGTRRGPASKFVPPVLSRDSDENSFGNRSAASSRQQRQDSDTVDPDNPVDERLKGIEPKMIELINNEIMDNGARITWSDIAGLEFAKKTIQEIVVWPMLRPDIFTGLRGPPKGLLLFGPPGTGKTLIGKCVASQSKSTFFCISASTLTSKWVGEGEKMVRALFAVARCHQPAVVFIDEIDSLLSQRSDAEHESSRRIKTEFLVQLDGAATESEDRILVIGATNRPQEIDEAARRRFVKRLLIPLPEAVARRQIVMNLMSQQRSNLNDVDIQAICDKTDGYSGADMTNLCREAALGPIRSIPFELMETITPDQVRPILYKDFEEALHQVRASVSSKDLELYTEWNKTYGSFGC